MSDKNAYCGIADAHGIESFLPAEDAPLLPLQIRAMANRHRHAVFYGVDLNDIQREVIDKLLKERKFQKALLVLKGMISEVRLHDKACKNSWDLIPNPKLDPWHR